MSVFKYSNVFYYVFYVCIGFNRDTNLPVDTLSDWETIESVAGWPNYIPVTSRAVQTLYEEIVDEVTYFVVMYVNILLSFNNYQL